MTRCACTRTRPEPSPWPRRRGGPCRPCGCRSRPSPAEPRVSDPKLTPYGERGLLVEVRSLEEVAMWAAAVRAAALPGVVDVVPAARSVLLHLARDLTPEQAARSVSGL